MAKKRKRSNGEGTIYRLKTGTWRAQVAVNGVRFGFTAKTQADCQIWLRNQLTKADQGLDFSRSQGMVADYLNSWIETASVALRPNTVHEYKRLMNTLILPALGKIQLKDLHLDRIEHFYASLKEEHPTTIRRVHAVLHRAFERAVKLGILFRNPAHGATLPRVPQKEMQILDESQVSQFLVAAKASRYEALYHLAIVTGMRQGELLGLKWTDLYWTSGTLYVRRQLQEVTGQGREFVEPKTRSGRRSIRLGEATLTVLRAHQEHQKLERLVVGKRWKENGLIFTSAVGTPVYPRNMFRDYQETLDQAGLPRIRFHDLRHTAASLMLNHGVPVIVASKRLGHAKPSITLDIYGHLINEMQEEAARIMDEVVTPVAVEIPAGFKHAQKAAQEEEIR
ncbi:MAG: site-specific integrase [Chloroflexi bacterium]|nr:site-specific integrase [Chloroflexota bacterium]